MLLERMKRRAAAGRRTWVLGSASEVGAAFGARDVVVDGAADVDDRDELVVDVDEVVEAVELMVEFVLDEVVEDAVLTDPKENVITLPMVAAALVDCPVLLDDVAVLLVDVGVDEDCAAAGTTNSAERAASTRTSARHVERSCIAIFIVYTRLRVVVTGKEVYPETSSREVQ